MNNRILLLLSLVACIAPAPAWSNWESVNTRTVQETTLNASQTASFRRDSFNAATGLGVAASAPMIQQGQWNTGVQFSPITPGGVFSLQMNRQLADPEPPTSTQAHSAPSSARTSSSANNQLMGIMTPTGVLQAGPGNRASEVNLTATQTLSVF